MVYEKKCNYLAKNLKGGFNGFGLSFVGVATEMNELVEFLDQRIWRRYMSSRAAEKESRRMSVEGCRKKDCGFIRRDSDRQGKMIGKRALDGWRLKKRAVVARWRNENADDGARRSVKNYIGGRAIKSL